MHANNVEPCWSNTLRHDSQMCYSSLLGKQVPKCTDCVDCNINWRRSHKRLHVSYYRVGLQTLVFQALL